MSSSTENITLKSDNGDASEITEAKAEASTKKITIKSDTGDASDINEPKAEASTKKITIKSDTGDASEINEPKAEASTKKITLKSDTGDVFEIDEEVALLSETIKHMIEDDCHHDGIPLPNVSSKILAKVIEYGKKHVETTGDDNLEALKDWDADFIKLDRVTLFEIILAANFLNIKSLLDLACQAVADSIKEKSVEEIRLIFNIENDYSPEEEAAVREENKWAFE